MTDTSVTDRTRKMQIERWVMAGLVVGGAAALVPVLRGLGSGGRAVVSTAPKVEAPAKRVSTLELIRQASDRIDAQSLQLEQASQELAPPPPSGPEVRYTAKDLRDPLVSLLPVKAPNRPKPEAPVGQSQAPSAPLQPPHLTVQGMIWGGARPQALIDRTLYGVGDIVQGAKIVAIDQGGVSIEIQGATFRLTPIQAPHGSASGRRSAPMSRPAQRVAPQVAYPSYVGGGQ